MRVVSRFVPKGGWFFIGLILAISLNVDAKTKEPQNRFVIFKNGKCGFIDRSGRVIIEPQFFIADDFSEGLAYVVRNPQEPPAYIDEAGTIVFEQSTVLAADFEARHFSEGLALVEMSEMSKDGQQNKAYIDRIGHVALVPPKVAGFFSNYGPFVEGFAIVGHDGYMDKTGQLVIKLQFQDARNFSEGLAAVLDPQTHKYGYIDKHGRWVITPQFDEVRNFSEGFAAVEQAGRYGFIDKSGRNVIPLKFVAAGDFSEGLAVVCVSGGVGPYGILYNGKCGYVDKTGVLAIEPQFSWGGEFSEGLAPVCVGDNITSPKSCGYIDTTGRMVIALRQCDDARPFSGGLAYVAVDYRIGYIDKTGKYVWEPTQ